MSGDVPRGSLCTTNDVSNLIEELQFTLGEGPCVDAYEHNRVVLEPDLAHPGSSRWLAFTPPAVEAGVGAVFGFPLQVGTGPSRCSQPLPESARPPERRPARRRVGDGRCDRELGPRRASQRARGFGCSELEQGADFHFIVHNAAGAVSVQLGVGITEALIRLRAYAFSNNHLLRDVAEDVMARRLRF